MLPTGLTVEDQTLQGQYLSDTTAVNYSLHAHCPAHCCHTEMLDPVARFPLPLPFQEKLEIYIVMWSIFKNIGLLFINVDQRMYSTARWSLRLLNFGMEGRWKQVVERQWHARKETWVLILVIWWTTCVTLSEALTLSFLIYKTGRLCKIHDNTKYFGLVPVLGATWGHGRSYFSISLHLIV